MVCLVLKNETRANNSKLPGSIVFAKINKDTSKFKFLKTTCTNKNVTNFWINILDKEYDSKRPWVQRRMSIIIAEDLRDEIRAHYLVPERYRIVIWALVGQKNRQGFVLKVAVFLFSSIFCYSRAKVCYVDLIYWLEYKLLFLFWCSFIIFVLKITIIMN